MFDLDPVRLVADASRLVRVRSLTGSEHEAVEGFAEIAATLGLEVEVIEHDIASVRARPGAPNSVAPRERLVGVIATLRGDGSSRRRLCVDGHLDVVPPGNRPWTHGPWSGLVADGRIHGRGSVDMKGPLVAALHGVAAAAAASGPLSGDVVFLGVSGEEDGGIGTFAALERDDDFAACVIPEPTAFDVVCGHAGAQQFAVRITGNSAHAGARLSGESALDRATAILAAVGSYEQEVNEGTRHELFGDCRIPYPISIGSIHGGHWPSQVIDEVELQGRFGVRLDETLDAARVGFERVLLGAFPDASAHVSIEWTGAFEPSVLPVNDDLTALAVSATSSVLGRPAKPSFVPWGADMYHFRRRGIPCVMLGPPSIEQAHAVDEAVVVDDLVQLALIYGRLARLFWDGDPHSADPNAA
jgi:acetylornithine deacetylase